MLLSWDVPDWVWFGSGFLAGVLTMAIAVGWILFASTGDKGH